MHKYKSSELNDIVGKITEKELQIAALGLKQAELKQERERLETALDSKTYQAHIYYEFFVQGLRDCDDGHTEWINRFWDKKDYFCEGHANLLETEQKAQQYLRVLEKKIKRFVGKTVHVVTNYLDRPYKVPPFPPLGKILEYRIPFAWLEREGKKTFVNYSKGETWEFGMLKGIFGFPMVPPPGADAFEVRPKTAYAPCFPPS